MKKKHRLPIFGRLVILIVFSSITVIGAIFDFNGIWAHMPSQPDLSIIVFGLILAVGGFIGALITFNNLHNYITKNASEL